MSKKKNAKLELSNSKWLDMAVPNYIYPGKWKRGDINKLGLSSDIDRSALCENNIIESHENIIDYIIQNEITDVVTVGPGGYKPFHYGHLLSVKTAIEKAKLLKMGRKNVCIVINTSCAGRRLKEKVTSTPWVIHRGTMFLVWSEFIQSSIENIADDIPILVSWNGRTTLYELLNQVNDKTSPLLKIHPLYSPDNLKQLEGIFKEDWGTETDERPNVRGFLQKREDLDGFEISGTKSRQYIVDGNETEFIRISEGIENSIGYFNRLKELYLENNGAGAGAGASASAGAGTGTGAGAGTGAVTSKKSKTGGASKKSKTGGAIKLSKFRRNKYKI